MLFARVVLAQGFFEAASLMLRVFVFPRNDSLFKRAGSPKVPSLQVASLRDLSFHAEGLPFWIWLWTPLMIIELLVST